MPDKYMVEQTIRYSDGTETTIAYHPNEKQAEIEQVVAEAVALNQEPEPEATVPEVEKFETEVVEPELETPYGGESF